MRLIKFYRKPNKPEVARLDKIDDDKVLITVNLHLSEGKRENLWLNLNSIHIDWIREVRDERETTNAAPASQA
jgi:hypothetical protein